MKDRKEYPSFQMDTMHGSWKIEGRIYRSGFEVKCHALTVNSDSVNFSGHLFGAFSNKGIMFRESEATLRAIPNSILSGSRAHRTVVLMNLKLRLEATLKADFIRKTFCVYLNNQALNQERLVVALREITDRAIDTADMFAGLEAEVLAKNETVAIYESEKVMQLVVALETKLATGIDEYGRNEDTAPDVALREVAIDIQQQTIQAQRGRVRPAAVALLTDSSEFIQPDIPPLHIVDDWIPEENLVQQNLVQQMDNSEISVNELAALRINGSMVDAVLVVEGGSVSVT